MRRRLVPYLVLLVGLAVWAPAPARAGAPTDQLKTSAEKDRQEFTALFTDLIERAYISKIERYSGERIAYAGEAVDGGLATVRTRFVTKQGTEVPVDYRMQQRGDRWLVYDVSVEGVSLINNYRTQFEKIIQTSSYAELVRKMKAA